MPSTQNDGGRVTRYRGLARGPVRTDTAELDTEQEAKANKTDHILEEQRQ